MRPCMDLPRGALAAGGLAGGVFAGIFARKLAIGKAGKLLIAGAGCMFPVGIGGYFISSAMAVYTVITACCFLAMVFATVFSVQVMSFIQAQTPLELVGKVIALVLTVSMCAQPLGNALYGVLFEICQGQEFMVILLGGRCLWGSPWGQGICFGNFRSKGTPYL